MNKVKTAVRAPAHTETSSASFPAWTHFGALQHGKASKGAFLHLLIENLNLLVLCCKIECNENSRSPEKINPKQNQPGFQLLKILFSSNWLC